MEEAGRECRQGRNGNYSGSGHSQRFGDHLHVANVGRQSDCILTINHEAIRQITRDHSLVEEMVRLGEMDKADAERSSG